MFLNNLGNISLKRKNSLEICQGKKEILVKNNFHESKGLFANITSKGDFSTLNKVKNVTDTPLLQKSIDIFPYTFKIEEKKIKSVGQYVLNKSVKVYGDAKSYKSYLLAKASYQISLRHDNVYDFKVKENGMVKVGYIPYSTSKNKVLCSAQTFNKILILSNTIYKDFYITRILYIKEMTKEEFIQWKANAISRLQDIKLKKQLFNEIQKDLDKHEYSVLKDEDILNPKVEFFTKELPRIKFQFTDLIE